MAATQQQVAALFQGLLSKGLETKDVLVAVQALVKARIYALDALTAENFDASGIPQKFRAKLIGRSGKRSSSSSSSSSSPPNHATAKKAKTSKSSSTNGKTETASKIVVPPVSAESRHKKSILINRSPVLTLWAAVVARQTLSISLEEALTFGSVFSAQCARSKGTSLGIYGNNDNNNDNHAGNNGAGNPKSADNDDDKKEETITRAFSLMGQTIRADGAAGRLRAKVGGPDGGQPVEPAQVWKSLSKKWGDDLPFVLDLMEKAAAAAGDKDVLDRHAFDYYVYIRPDIPSGTRGWGAHGHLYLSRLLDYFPLRNSDNGKPMANQG